MPKLTKEDIAGESLYELNELEIEYENDPASLSLISAEINLRLEELEAEWHEDVKRNNPHGYNRAWALNALK